MKNPVRGGKKGSVSVHRWAGGEPYKTRALERDVNFDAKNEVSGRGNKGKGGERQLLKRG